MAPRFPPRLKAGDLVRVVAPCRSPAALQAWSGFGADHRASAVRRLEGMGLRVSFGARVEETTESGVAPIASRLADLHDAFRDDEVRAILGFSGGMGAIQILDGIDYGLAAAHPKLLVGYSDVSHLHLALLARAGLAGAYGPNFTSFAMARGFERSEAWFRERLFGSGPVDLVPAETWSDDNWDADQENRTFRPNDGFWCLREGAAEGTVVGCGVHALNALQGTPYFPDLDGAILFLESPGQGKASLMTLDGALRSLAMLPAFRGVAGIVLGRYPSSARITREGLQGMVHGIEALGGIPVVANVDFGHTTPAMTIPVGGSCRMEARAGTARLTLHAP